MEQEWEEGLSFHRLISQAMRLYFVRSYQVLEKLEVHPGQAPLLFELHRHRGLYQRELCDRLCVRPSTLTVMIRRTEKGGLVERRPDEKDQRMMRIYLTEKGASTVRALFEATKTIEAECFEGVSEEETALLKRLAMQVRDNLSKRLGSLPENPRREGDLC